MSISPINRVAEIYKQNAQAIKGNTGSNDGSGDAFSVMFNAFKGVVNDTAKLQNASDDITTDFITGKTDDIHQVMIAAEKANVALQFTTELRNKAVDSYKEIMRMQI